MTSSRPSCGFLEIPFTPPEPGPATAGEGLVLNHRYYITPQVKENRFQIAGGTPGLKVSWQVTGIRQDAYAQKHRIQVEEEKPAAEQGLYLNPDAFGQPPELGISWAKAHPPAPKPEKEVPSQPAPTAEPRH